MFSLFGDVPKTDLKYFPKEALNLHEAACDLTKPRPENLSPQMDETSNTFQLFMPLKNSIITYKNHSLTLIELLNV